MKNQKHKRNKTKDDNAVNEMDDMVKTLTNKHKALLKLRKQLEKSGRK